MKTDINKTIIITPYKLTENQKSRLTKTLPFLEKLEVENVTDKELIGGFVVQRGSTVYDASIKGLLDKLVNQLYESSRQGS